MLGFRTDFSATQDVDYTFEEKLLSITDIEINIYHISGGLTFTLLKNKFILGVDFGISSSNNLNDLINYTQPLVINENGIPLRGNIQPISKQNIYSLGFVFGYSFNF
jgi:hypothetical protein